MFPGGEFHPSGKLTQEAVGIVVGAIKDKLDQWEKAGRETLREAGVARRKPSDVGYDQKTAAELENK